MDGCCFGVECKMMSCFVLTLEGLNLSCDGWFVSCNSARALGSYDMTPSSSYKWGLSDGAGRDLHLY